MGENRWILNITSNSQLTVHCKIVLHWFMESIWLLLWYPKWNVQKVQWEKYKI